MTKRDVQTSSKLGCTNWNLLADHRFLKNLNWWDQFFFFLSKMSINTTTKSLSHQQWGDDWKYRFQKWKKSKNQKIPDLSGCIVPLKKKKDNVPLILPSKWGLVATLRPGWGIRKQEMLVKQEWMCLRTFWSSSCWFSEICSRSTRFWFYAWFN